MVPSLEEEKLSSAAKPAARPRRSARSMLTILALLVLTSLVGVGATLGVLWANGQIGVATSSATVHVPTVSPQTPTATSSTTTPSAQSNQLPTPTAFQTVNSSEVGIIVKYPADWVADPPQKSADSDMVGFHPQQQNGIFFSIERFTASASAQIGSTKEVNQGNITPFSSSQNFHDFHTISSSTSQRTLGGEKWDEQDAAFKNSNGVSFHITSIAVQHNHIYYDIFFSAPDPNYDEAMQKYFQPMFNSFQFEK